MQKDLKIQDPNYFARKKSEQVWEKYMTSSKLVAAWILTANFFFGVLPGILFFATNVRLSQEEDESIPNVLPDFNRVVNWFGIIFVLFPIVVSVFQMFKFYRLISMRMTRTFFIGQIVGFIFYMCAFSKTILRKFQWFPKKSTFIGLVIILVLLVMILFFLPYLFLFSEMVSYKIHHQQIQRSSSTDTITLQQQQQQQQKKHMKQQIKNLVKEEPLKNLRKRSLMNKFKPSLETLKQEQHQSKKHMKQQIKKLRRQDQQIVPEKQQIRDSKLVINQTSSFRSPKVKFHGVKTALNLV